jgi:uncharacterized protein YdhG (YjbR/CyaY superfamily)
MDNKPETVDEYIAGFPAEVRPILEEVRGAIRRAIPGVEEVISYDIPTYRLNGSYVIYFAGWKKHIALYPVTQTMAEKLKDDLAGYKGSKSSLHFPLNKPMPLGLIARIIEVRLGEMSEKNGENKTGSRL